jgi:hypothetical protein
MESIKRLEVGGLAGRPWSTQRLLKALICLKPVIHDNWLHCAVVKLDAGAAVKLVLLLQQFCCIHCVGHVGLPVYAPRTKPWKLT